MVEAVWLDGSGSEHRLADLRKSSIHGPRDEITAPSHFRSCAL